MKLFYSVFILLSALILSGCIDDDTSDCSVETEDNFILKFRYVSSVSGDNFTEKIQQVNVYIFSQDGKYITTQTVDLAALTAFAGITLHLDPGSYRIICWGNASSKTFVNPLGIKNTFTDAYLSNIATRDGTFATNGDQLYYASDNLVLSPTLKATTTNIIERILNFKNAYIKIQLYTKGMIDKNQQGQLLPPTIEMINIPSRYNFLMQTDNSTIRYLNTSSFQDISGEEVAVVTFYTPRFSDNNSIEIHIKKSSDGNTLTTINLKDFMKENNITVEGIEEAVVPILIEYKQASVEIGIPEWKQNPVEPEL